MIIFEPPDVVLASDDVFPSLHNLSALLFHFLRHRSRERRSDTTIGAILACTIHQRDTPLDAGQLVGVRDETLVENLAERRGLARS